MYLMTPTRRRSRSKPMRSGMRMGRREEEESRETATGKKKRPSPASSRVLRRERGTGWKRV